MTKYTTWLAAAVLALGITQPAGAVNITDDYWGATPPTSYSDVVGAPAQFDISDMDVSLVGNTLTVTINTNFSGSTNGTLDAYFGDLFLASAWDPDTSDPNGANYLQDDAASGTTWEYGFALDGRNVTTGAVGSTTGDSSGTGSLYDFSSTDNSVNAYLSDDYFGSGYREGQEVVVKDTTTSIGTGGTWESKAGYITFEIDVTGTTLSSDGIAVHWAMTCANDVIEGFVPAPGILLVMAMGLFGIAGSSVARKRKTA